MFLNYLKRMLLKKPKKQTLALLIFDDSVLMGKRNDSNTWTFIGGGVENNETPLQGMMREIREETGLTYGEKDLEFVAKYIVEDREIYIYKGIFKATMFENLTSEYDIDHECSDLGFYKISDLLNKKINIKLTFPYDVNVGIQALKKLYGDNLTFDSVEVDSVEDNLLYQIKKEAGLKKLKLIKEFKNLPAGEKLKIMKEYQNSLNDNEEPTQTIDEHLETPPVEEPTLKYSNKLNLLETKSNAGGSIKGVLLKGEKFIKENGYDTLKFSFKNMEGDMVGNVYHKFIAPITEIIVEIGNSTTGKNREILFHKKEIFKETNLIFNYPNFLNAIKQCKEPILQIMEDNYSKIICKESGNEISIEEPTSLENNEQNKTQNQEPKNEDDIVEQAKEILSKGTDITLEDLEFFDFNNTSKIDDLIKAGNEKAKGLLKQVENLIEAFQATMDEVLATYGDIGAEFDDVNGMRLSDLLKKLFIDNEYNSKRNERDRMKALEKIRKLFKMDNKIAMKIKNLISSIDEDDDIEDNTPSLFDSVETSLFDNMIKE